jgi:hypothetical protein
MLPLNLTNSIRPFQVLSIVAMLLAIAPTVQAAPKMAQRVAMKDQPLCFVQLPGKTTNLDKLCGLGNKGKTADKNGVFNLDIDVNRDGISDQFLDAAQQFLDSQEKAFKDYQAAATPKLSEQATNQLFRDYEAAHKERDQQYAARFPYSSRVRQLQAEELRVVERLNQLDQSDKQGRKTLEARIMQISQEYTRDPSYIKVEEAQTKVFKEIQRRGSAKWLYPPSPQG